MDSAQRTHLEHLLQIHGAHLRELELQAAKYGDLATPPHVTLQIAEYRQKIAELERRMRELLPRHNLPPRDYERFVGRQKELAEVRRLLLPYPRSRAYVVTIDGIGGIGKSALALETAYTYCDQYAALPEAERFEALVWVSAKRTYLTTGGLVERRQAFRTLDDLFTAIAQVLDFPAITRAPAQEQRAIVEQVLREQRTLLLLDNLEAVDDEDLLVFLRELPDPAKALVTTRHRIDVAHPVRLAGMPHADALALIDQEAARKDVTLAVEEREALWQRTGGVPLAIVWSVGLMGLGGSVESVLRRLGQGQSDIARFCFEESVAQIRGKDAHRLLLALALFAADASREALGVVAGLGEDEFGRDMGLEELLRLSLVNKEGERFSLLPLTRSFVQSEAEKQEDWMVAARERWQMYFYELSHEYGGWSHNWRGHDLVERELPNITIAIDDIISRLQYEPTIEGNSVISKLSFPQAKRALDFMGHVARTCRIRGYWNDWETLSLRMLRLGRGINDLEHVGWCCFNLTHLSFHRHNLDAATQYTIEARTIGKRIGDAWMVCLANRQLGVAAMHLGNLEEAASLLKIAFDEVDEIGDKQLIRHFMGTMGDLALQQGDLVTATSTTTRLYHSR